MMTIDTTDFQIRQDAIDIARAILSLEAEERRTREFIAARERLGGKPRPAIAHLHHVQRDLARMRKLVEEA